MIFTITFPECRPEANFFNGLQSSLEEVCENVERREANVADGILTFEFEVQDANHAESAILRVLRRYGKKLKVYSRDQAKEYLQKVVIINEGDTLPVDDDEAESILKDTFDK